jgi:hypothetical protein
VKTVDKNNLDRRVQQTSTEQLNLLRSNATVGVPNETLNGISSD